ncbi:ANR family transcriptional regulator [Pectobacterium zantedeschiae]|uniref:ANR family transcriptional regulator n=1 Tax=Pectobacterium zantedeschiae TaxID=2034769 RepID=UPI0032EAAF7D
MNNAYKTAATHAAEYERARNFPQAKVMWLTAARHAGIRNKFWCELRAEFCEKWHPKLEVVNG